MTTIPVDFTLPLEWRRLSPRYAQSIEVVRYPLPEDRAVREEIRKLIAAEVGTCLCCATNYAHGRLLRFCDWCGADRDREWYARIVRLAGEAVG